MLYIFTHVKGNKRFQRLVESKYYGFFCTARAWGAGQVRGQAKALASFLPLSVATVRDKVQRRLL